MTIETLQEKFIQEILANPPQQIVEEAASESHETRRIPDPWLYLSQNGKLITPQGQIVEEAIEKKGYLEELEFQALQRIQDWASQENSGVMLWFSPPFDGRYEASKVMISEIVNVRGNKVLFNRAVVLDLDATSLLNLANSFSNEGIISHPEILRSTPLFPSNYEFKIWFQNLAAITPQTEMIGKGEDLKIKNQTYHEMEEIRVSTVRSGKIPTYVVIYQEADRRGLIGEYAGSCGGGKSAFEAFSENALPLGETKTLNCTCPFCHAAVSASISGGRIHCPNCGASAPYHC